MLKTLLVPAILFGLASAAAATEAPRQCPAPWSRTSADAPVGVTCRVGDERALRQLSAYEPDADAPHLITKVEARAELDAIRISPSTQFADQHRLPQRPGSGE
jgi:hypothetical protein